MNIRKERRSWMRVGRGRGVSWWRCKGGCIPSRIGTPEALVKYWLASPVLFPCATPTSRLDAAIKYVCTPSAFPAWKMAPFCPRTPLFWPEKSHPSAAATLKIYSARYKWPFPRRCLLSTTYYVLIHYVQYSKHICRWFLLLIIRERALKLEFTSSGKYWEGRGWKLKMRHKTTTSRRGAIILIIRISIMVLLIRIALPI